MPDQGPSSLEHRAADDEIFQDAVNVLREARLHLRETIGFCSSETTSLVFKTAQNLIESSELSSEDQLRLGKELEQLT
jgi:hypothetical protein